MKYFLYRKKILAFIFLFSSLFLFATLFSSSNLQGNITNPDFSEYSCWTESFDNTSKDFPITFTDGSVVIKDPDFLIIENGTSCPLGIFLAFNLNTAPTTEIFRVYQGNSYYDIPLTMPLLNQYEVRWAPDIYYDNEKLYMYYARGQWLDNPSVSGESYGWHNMRLYVSEANLNPHSDFSQVPHISFSSEQHLNVLNYNDFGGSSEYGVIDPEIFIDENEQKYLTYTVVLYGISGVRNHEEFVRIGEMNSFIQATGQHTDRAVYDGFAGDPDDGVAESSSFLHHNGQYLMMISSRPTDNDQKILKQVFSSVASISPSGTWEEYLSSENTSDDARSNGVGGQSILPFNENSFFLIYQGKSMLDGKFRIMGHKVPQAEIFDFVPEFSFQKNYLTVDFSDTTIGFPTSWEWDFDNDGTIDSTLQNPSYTYTNSGTYTVSLTISDGNFTSSISQEITVESAPPMSIEIQNSIGDDITNGSTTENSVLVQIDNALINGEIPKMICLPTWSNKNGQDDIQWYTANKDPLKNQFTFTVQFSEHSFDLGVYNFHVYGQTDPTKTCTDTAYLTELGGVTVTVENPIENYSITFARSDSDISISAAQVSGSQYSPLSQISDDGSTEYLFYCRNTPEIQNGINDVWRDRIWMQSRNIDIQSNAKGNWSIPQIILQGENEQDVKDLSCSMGIDSSGADWEMYYLASKRDPADDIYIRTANPQNSTYNSWIDTGNISIENTPFPITGYIETPSIVDVKGEKYLYLSYLDRNLVRYKKGASSFSSAENLVAPQSSHGHVAEKDGYYFFVYSRHATDAHGIPHQIALSVSPDGVHFTDPEIIIDCNTEQLSGMVGNICFAPDIQFYEDGGTSLFFANSPGGDWWGGNTQIIELPLSQLSLFDEQNEIFTFEKQLSVDFTSAHINAYEVSFQGQSPNTITSWQWDFDGDDIIDSNEQNPTHIYSIPGTHTVSLTVSDGNFSKTISHDVIIENNAPTDIHISRSYVLENSSSGTIIANISTIDENNGDIHSYSLVSEEFQGAFQIINDELQIQTPSLFDSTVHSEISLRIRSTDQSGDFFEKDFVIDILSESTSIKIKDSQNQDITNGSTSENSFTVVVNNPLINGSIPAGSICIPTWTSAHGQDDIRWYDVAKTTDQNQFTHTIHITDHFSEIGLYHIHVYAHEDATKKCADPGLVLLQGITLTIEDVEDIFLSSNVVPEMPPVNYVIGTLDIPQFQGAPTTFHIPSPNEAALFRIRENVLEVRDPEFFDFETTPENKKTLPIEAKNELTQEKRQEVFDISILDISNKALVATPTGAFNNTVSLKIFFLEESTGLDLSDFEVTGGILTDLSGSGRIYTATLQKDGVSPKTSIRIPPSASIVPPLAEESVLTLSNTIPSEISLDNGIIKLKVDVANGGAISYVSQSGKERNLINTYDRGRELQQSYYAGQSINRTAEGQSSNWSPWAWNPVQAGDTFLNASPILDWNKDGDTLYIKTQPYLWDMNQELSESYMEAWITLDENVIQVENALTVFRTDERWNKIERNQEAPAVYPISALDQLYIYDGEEPFTNAPVTNTPVVKLSSGFWGVYDSVPEHWMAFLDSSGSGVGIYTPNSSYFLAGMSGNPGGEFNSPSTSYISPIIPARLSTESTYLYSYEFIVGDLDQIRARVYKQEESKVALTSRFFSTENGSHTISFTDSSYGSPTSWEWDFNGDDIIDSTIQNPTHIFSTPGAHLVKLTISNGTHTDTTLQNVIVPTPSEYSLALSKIGTGTGIITSNPAGINCGEVCVFSFHNNTSITLSATPESGSVFSHWTGCDSVNSNECTVIINSEKNISAEFEDGEKPIISLLGSDSMTIFVGEDFLDPGYTATDNIDGDITGNIIVGGDVVDTNTTGTYIITYNVSDATGNKATEGTRTVIVEEEKINEIRWYNLPDGKIQLQKEGNSVIQSWEYQRKISEQNYEDTSFLSGNNEKFIHTFNAGETYKILLHFSDGTPSIESEFKVSHNALYFHQGYRYFGIQPKSEENSYYRINRKIEGENEIFNIVLKNEEEQKGTSKIISQEENGKTKYVIEYTPPNGGLFMGEEDIISGKITTIDETETWFDLKIIGTTLFVPESSYF